MNESIKNLLERRSIRAYKKELVPKETLDTILEAGEYSPSGMGQQSTLMVVTQDPELVARLSKMNAAVMGSTSDPFYGAPTVIIVFSDSKMGTCVENGSLVMGNLMFRRNISAWATVFLDTVTVSIQQPNRVKMVL